MPHRAPAAALIVLLALTLSGCSLGPSKHDATKADVEQYGAPTARCKDETYDYDSSHASACEGHGGVAYYTDDLD